MLQSSKELSKFPRNQAFVMVRNSDYSGHMKGVVGRVVNNKRYSHPMHVYVKNLRLRGQGRGDVYTFIENVTSIAPFTIGMSVKPQEGWKVIRAR